MSMLRAALRPLLQLAPLVLLCGACKEATPPPAQTRFLTILHTNDWHGYAFAEPHEDLPAGGVLACAAEVRQLRQDRPQETLVLDGGDLLSGHAAARFEDQGVRGLPFVQLWDGIGFDAWALGNHDLDHGRDNLVEMLTHMKAPLLCANWLEDASGGAVAAVPGETNPPVDAESFRVFERAGLRVGVLGLVTQDLRDLVARSTLAGTVVLPPADALRALWPAFDAASDIQILLSHCGLDVDKELAAAFPGLEAIVGGHSHSFVEEPVQVGPVVIVQAGCYGRSIGRLDLEIREGQVVANQGRLIRPMRPPDADADAELLAAEQSLLARVRGLEAQVVGIIPRTLGRSYHELSPVGWVAAEAYRRAAAVEIGFANSGGLRTDLEAGPFTRAELLAFLPFDNELVRFALTGEKLEALCRRNAWASLGEEYGILQFAGLSYTLAPHSTADDLVIESILVDGQPLDPARSYSCAGSDYITTTRGERYFGQIIEPRQRLGIHVRDAFEEALAGDLMEQANERFAEKG